MHQLPSLSPSFGSPFMQGPGSMTQAPDMMGLGMGMGMPPQMGMMNGIMQMMMQSMMQMMQGLMGMGQNGAALQSQPQFGAQGMGGSPSGSGGLQQFLGGSNGGSGAAGSGTTGSTSGAGATAELPEGVKGLTFEKAAELVKKGGGELNPGGRPTVLAIRTKTAATSSYEDVYVVLKKDGTMENFKGSTQPTRSGNDRAMLKPGAYEISPRWRDGKFSNDAFLVKSKSGSMNVGVGRDSNGDGVYSDAEMNANTSSSQIRLHRGKANSTSSSGCLNVQNYDGFLNSVGGRDSNFNMVVVTI